MAETTDLERLVVALEAQSVKLDRAITATAQNVDRQLGAMEKRTELMRTRMESSFANAGANSLKKFANALLATGAFVAIERFVSSIVTLAEGIKHTSDVTGVSTDNLQAWAIAARHAGVDAESFNAGIERFTANYGKAIGGNKQLQAEFKRLGITLDGNVNKALLDLSDRLHNTSDGALRVAVVTQAFGRDMKNLTPFLSQGSQALQDWVAQLKANGSIIDEQGIKKIDEMKQKWEDLKTKLEVAAVPAVLTFFDKFGALIDKVSSPGFQQGLQAFSTSMAQVAGAIASIPPQYWTAIIGAAVGGKTFGLPGAVFGGIGGAVIGQQSADQNAAAAAADAALGSPSRTLGELKDLYAQRDALKSQTTLWATLTDDADKHAEKLAKIAALQDRINAVLKSDAAIRPSGKPGTATTPSGKGIPKDVFAPAGGDTAKRLAAEAQARLDALNRLVREQVAADNELQLDQDKLNVELLQGQAGYHAAVLKMIDDEKAAKLEAIKADETAQIDALGKLQGLTEDDYNKRVAIIHALSDAKRKAADVDAQRAAFDTGLGKIEQDALLAGEEQIRQNDTETKSLGLVGGALARVAFVQSAYNEAKKQGIPITQEFIDKVNKEADSVEASAQALHDATRKMQDDIAVADEFRSGLTDVFAAGLKGWKAMEQAAGNFLQQMSETILKTYVLKPLLENLFGEQGTPLGGLIGNLFGTAGGIKRDGSTPQSAVYVSDVNAAGGTGTGNPIADLIKDIGQTGGPNTTGSKSLLSTVEGGTTGASDPAQILADGFQQGSKDISSAITDSGGDVASGLTDALKGGGNFLSDVLGSAFKAGGDLLSTIFNSLGSLLGGGGGGGGGGFLGSIFSSIFGSAGVAGGSTLADIPAEVIASSGFFSDGGVMTNRGPLKLRKYAGGGIASTPQLAMFGEGDGPEAFVPLKGGAIPVQFKAPVAKTQPIVNVYQTVHADRSILADDVFRKIEKSKNEAIDVGSKSGAALALRAQPGRQEQFRKLGT